MGRRRGAPRHRRPKSRPLADALAKRGFTVATAALAQLQPGQVLLLSAHAITEADMLVLRKFLESGGGLLTCATGWGWAQGGKISRTNSPPTNCSRRSVSSSPAAP